MNCGKQFVSEAETYAEENNFCIKCGERLDKNASFCSACGERIQIIDEKVNNNDDLNIFEIIKNKLISYAFLYLKGYKAVVFLFIVGLFILYSIAYIIHLKMGNISHQNVSIQEQTPQIEECMLEPNISLRSATIQINSRIIYLSYSLPLPTKGYDDEQLTYNYVVGRSSNGTFKDNAYDGWIRTEELINQIKNSFGLQINIPDYNPDYLLAPGSEQYIRLFDNDGILLTTIYAYNRQNTTLSLKDCDAVETYWNTDTDMDYSKVINKYGYFFGGINVFSGEWDYDKVKNEIAKETGEYTVNESNAGEYLLVTVQAYNVGYGYWYGYDDSDWYGTHEDELHSYDIGIIYRFYFDPVTRMLVSMDVN